jgi:hypothetical protein
MSEPRLTRIISIVGVVARMDLIGQRCACRKPRPRRSCGMPVFVEDATEAFVSAYVDLSDLVGLEYWIVVLTCGFRVLGGGHAAI